MFHKIFHGEISLLVRSRELCYIFFFFRKHGILRHSSNYPSFVNSRMSSHPDIPVYNPVRQLADNYFNDARSMKLGKRMRFSFLRVIKGINQTNKSNTVEENNRGEGTNMFRIYGLDAFIDRPIYMHDLYALYEVFQSAPHMAWTDSIIRELHHYFSSMYSPRLWFPRVSRQIMGKSEGISLYVNNLHWY